MALGGKDGTAAANDNDCLIVDDVTLEPEVSPFRFVKEPTGRLMVTDCLFKRRNSAKSMVFVYNDDALVNDIVFAENTVEVSEAVGFGQRDNHVAGTGDSLHLGVNVRGGRGQGHRR